MQLGQFQLNTISGGRFRIDGGTMFGVVPKVLWSRHIDVADDNTIRQATNCVLVRTGSQTILIDTGYGPKLTAKQRKIFQSEDGDPLLSSLQEQGLTPDDVDVVILSHLHFDHAGGAVRRDEDGNLVPTFARAEYVTQRSEWETATAELPELVAAYPLDNLLPLGESGQLRLIDGDEEILPGIRAEITGGHTAAHMALWIESEGQAAVYLGDICPTWRHLPMLWGMGYDVDVLQVRRAKPRLLDRVVERDAWALSDHDPDHAAARLEPDSKRDFAVVEALEVL